MAYQYLILLPELGKVALESGRHKEFVDMLANMLNMKVAPMDAGASFIEVSIWGGKKIQVQPNVAYSKSLAHSLTSLLDHICFQSKLVFKGNQDRSSLIQAVTGIHNALYICGGDHHRESIWLLFDKLLTITPSYHVGHLRLQPKVNYGHDAEDVHKLLRFISVPSKEIWSPSLVARRRGVVRICISFLMWRGNVPGLTPDIWLSFRRTFVDMLEEKSRNRSSPFVIADLDALFRFFLSQNISASSYPALGIHNQYDTLRWLIEFGIQRNITIPSHVSSRRGDRSLHDDSTQWKSMLFSWLGLLEEKITQSDQATPPSAEFEDVDLGPEVSTNPNPQLNFSRLARPLKRMFGREMLWTFEESVFSNQALPYIGSEFSLSSQEAEPERPGGDDYTDILLPPLPRRRHLVLGSLVPFLRHFSQFKSRLDDDDPTGAVGKISKLALPNDVVARLEEDRYPMGDLPPRMESFSESHVGTDRFARGVDLIKVTPLLENHNDQDEVAGFDWEETLTLPNIEVLEPSDDEESGEDDRLTTSAPVNPPLVRSKSVGLPVISEEEHPTHPLGNVSEEANAPTLYNCKSSNFQYRLESGAQRRDS